MTVIGMIDHQPRRVRACHEGLALRVTETEPHVLYRADAAVVALSGVKNAWRPLIADTDAAVTDRRSARSFVETGPPVRRAMA